MNTAYTECSLFLSPVDTGFHFDDVHACLSSLQDTGFISHPVNEQAGTFYTGERFLEYIAYMGCSPAVQFEASDDSDNFCHIRLHQYDEPVLIVSRKQYRPPQCPRCNKPVRSFDVDQQGKEATPERIYCESCHETSATAEFGWRKMGGCARIFIEVTDIFPKEAIPQQSFLDKLNSITQTEWKYFYSCR